eukprot:12823948-Alexandrium_andersonii.AAC.1
MCIRDSARGTPAPQDRPRSPGGQPRTPPPHGGGARPTEGGRGSETRRHRARPPPGKKERKKREHERRHPLHRSFRGAPPNHQSTLPRSTPLSL